LKSSRHGLSTAEAAARLAFQHWSDALFIGAVLLINALIGTVQEFSAQRAASALSALVTTSSRVLRDSEAYEIDATGLVPGDVVLLETGDRVPADLRLLASQDLGAARRGAPGGTAQHGLCRHPGDPGACSGRGGGHGAEYRAGKDCCRCDGPGHG